MADEEVTNKELQELVEFLERFSRLERRSRYIGIDEDIYQAELKRLGYKPKEKNR